jgi:hypothetical protein
MDMGCRHHAPTAGQTLLRHLDLVEQIGMTIQHFEQLDQR